MDVSRIAAIVGERIRSYRNMAKLSHESLAERSGCHPTYIGQVERGEKNATVESLWKIARALEIPLSQLFEKLEGTESFSNNYPLLCYELIVAAGAEEQERLYRILKEIIEFGKQS